MDLFEEFTEEFNNIVDKAFWRMEQGKKLHGDKLDLQTSEKDALEEFDEEIADAINYLVLAKLKVKRLRDVIRK